MDDSSKYNVKANGEILDGFHFIDVQESFALLFKISEEKAFSIVGSKRVLKKDLDLKSAEAFLKKLENIGLGAEIEIIGKPKPVVTPIPISSEDDNQEVQQEIPKPKPSVVAPLSWSLEPVAEAEDVKQPEQKVSAQSYAPNKKVESVRSESTPPKAPTSQPLKLGMLLAPLIAAICGAFFWAFMVVKMNVEFGWLAWVIGGVIGAVAAIANAKGNAAGIICAFFAFFAIWGGKFITAECLEADWYQQMIVPEQLLDAELQKIYEDEVELAGIYAKKVKNENSLRQFMIDNEYTESEDRNTIPKPELMDFRENIEPRLQKISDESLSYEDWLKYDFKFENEKVSTLDRVTENFGMLDIVFLIFAMGTAFRLGRGGEVSPKK